MTPGRLLTADTRAAPVSRCRAGARVTAHSLMSTQPEAGLNWLNGTFFVTDATGEIVLEMPFSEVVGEDALPQLN